MGILTRLVQGQKIKFMTTDTDSYSYDEENSLLLQIINNEETGYSLVVTEVNEITISVEWEIDLVHTYYEDDLIFVE
jgi:hypothetical protein